MTKLVTILTGTIAALVAAMLIVGSQWWRPAPWGDAVPLSLPYPTFDKGTEPIHVSTSQLPALDGYSSIKPVVAADGLGNVAVVSYGVINTPLGCDILLRRSSDRGATWGDLQNLTNSAQAGEMNFDPWMDTDGHGHYYLVYGNFKHGRPVIRRSKDFARSWSDSLQIPWKSCDRPVLGISPNGKTLVVAASMAERSAQAPTAPLNSSDSRKLQDALRAAFVTHAGVFVSIDHGSSWRKQSSPFGSEHAIPFAAVVDDSSRVAASWIVEGGGSRSVVSVSHDGGKAWTITTLVDSLQPDRPHPFNGERFPVLATDGSGSLHVAYVSAGAKKLLLQSSTDWKIWKDATLLSDASVDEVRMAAIDARGPMVHVTWMERANDTWHAYYRGSCDSGETWSQPLCLSKAIRLSDASMADGFQICGDDDQSSVHDDGQGRVHAVWSFQGGRIAHAIIEW